MNREIRKGILWCVRVIRSEKRKLASTRERADRKKDTETSEECAIAEDALDRVDEIMSMEASRNGHVLPKVAKRRK